MRVLGIDLGIKKTGLALSDGLGISARALPNRVPLSRAEDVVFLLELIQREEVAAVVVGLPLLPQSGDDGPMAKRARGFAAALQDALQTAGSTVQVALLDERHSTQEATQRLVASGVKRSNRKAARDAEVARGLVLDWLASRGRSAP